MNLLSCQKSFAASICGPVPRTGGSNGPGLRGVMNAVADRVAYQVAESNRPRWPYIPPPRVEVNELALAFS